MGYDLAKAVYKLDKDATTATEQAVLLALAFRANDQTLLCYPKQDTLAQMTHLHRATVAQCLNMLRQKGIIDWKSGGLKNKRGTQGRPLANDYRLNLAALGKMAVDKGAQSVVQRDTAVSSSATQQCCPARHRSVVQGDTAVSSSTTPIERQQPIQKEDTSSISNRSVSNSDSAFDKALRSVGVAGADSSMKEQSRREWAHEQEDRVLQGHVRRWRRLRRHHDQG